MAQTTASWVDLDDAEQPPPQEPPGRDAAPLPDPRGLTGRAVALAVGLAVATSAATAVVVQHRAEALAAARPPHVEVGYPEVRALTPERGALRARVVLPVHNPGDAPVTVTSVDLTARAGPASLVRPTAELAPGARAQVVLETRPRCAVAATGERDVVSLGVRGSDGTEHAVSAELAAPFGRPALDAQLEDLCSSTGTGRPVEVAVSLLPDRRTLVLRLTNASAHPTHLALWAPSASGIISDPPLPLELAQGEEVSVSLTATPTCETWSGGLPSRSVDVVSSRPPTADSTHRDVVRDVPSGWSALLTSWLGGQVARTCGTGA